jgi:hypothetical protein
MKHALARTGLLAVVVATAATTVAVPHTAVSGPDGLLVTACCWGIRLLAGWLLVGIAAALVCASGRGPAAVRCHLAPLAPVAIHAAVRWAGVGSVAAAVATAATVPAAAAPLRHPGGHRPGAAGATGSTSLSLDWPVAERDRAPVVAPPVPAFPSRQAASQPAAGVSRPARTPERSATSEPPAEPPKPAGAVASTARTRDRGSFRPSAPRRRRRAVIVQPGDSLWSIAAARTPHASPAAVDRAWHRWWHTNRRVVGPDPDLIYPGQRLVVPGSASTSASIEGQP